MKKHVLLFTLILFMGFTQVGWGQVSLTSTGTPFTQNFNTLANSGTSNTWTDNTTITGWYTNRVVYIGDAGASTTGGLHSYGTVLSGECAIGALTSSSVGTVYIGARLVNNTGGNITSFDVAYKGEQWRQTANAQKLVFEYQVGATSLTTGTWTAVTALDFTAPKTGTAGALDGNASGNYTNLSSTISVSVSNTQEIWFRWTKTASTSPGLAVDDFSVTATGGSTAPLITTPTVTSITDVTALLGANITSDGGSAITERGTVWKTTTGVAITDNILAEGGTATGVFTQTRSSLTSGTQIFFKAYATNSIGTTLSSESSFYTLSTEPLAHAASFTNSIISQTQIDLSFSAASSITNAVGYIILQKTGSAPTGTPTDGSAYSVGNAIGDGTVAAVITNSASTSSSITGLIAGTSYYFTLIPYNYNGVNNETYNYYTAATIPGTNGTTDAPNDQDSYVDAPVTQVNPVLVSSIADTDPEAVEVFRFKINDTGNDALSTIVTQVTIQAGSNNTASWSTIMQGVKLSIDGGSTFVTTGTPTINAASIVFPITAGNLSVDNAGNATISLFIYFKTTGLSDNQVLEFTIPTSSHGFTADATGSTFLTTFVGATTSNQMLIDIVATKLKYIQQPTNTIIDVIMTPVLTIEATDVNNNRDLDKTGSVALVSSGTMTGSVSATLTSGFGTFSDIVHTTTGTGLTLTASLSGLTDAVSNTFDIVNGSLLLEENFDYVAGTALTANGWTAHSSGGTNPILVAVSGLTYSGYANSGIGLSASIPQGSGEDVNRTFTSVTSGSVYVSALMNCSAAGTGDYFFTLGTGTTSFTGRLFIKTDGSGGFNFGITKSATSGSATWTGSYALSTTYLVVLKYSYVAGATNDVISLFVNPSLGGTEPAATITNSVEVGGTDALQITAVYFRQGTSATTMPAVLIDGIRVSNAWSEAPLPVELTSFSALLQNKTVNLIWKTATEVNNYGFEIQKTSPRPSPYQGEGVPTGRDGRGWVTVGFVTGAGNSNSPKEYSFTDKSAASGKYLYRLKQVDNDGQYKYSQEIEVYLGSPTAFALEQNFPNPFNPTTSMQYSVSSLPNGTVGKQFVVIKVFDMLGREVAILVNGEKEPGTYTAEFSTTGLASGTYIYRMQSGEFVQTRKMVILK